MDPPGSAPPPLCTQPEEFERSARQDVSFLVEAADLQRHERILDVGCGAGRLAIGLVDYLAPDGRYEGFDVHRQSVAWAVANVAAGDPRFRFTHVDVRNGSYNPRGREDATTFHFPYSDSTFDLAVLLSVFTHQVPDEMSHYLSQIARVLVPGGRCLATYFLLEGPQRLRLPKLTLDFVHDLGGYYAVDRKVPEKAVAYQEPFVRRVWGEAGLPIMDVLPAKWVDPAGPRWKQVVIGHRPR
jgi:SAM-dependent methyltransferase